MPDISKIIRSRLPRPKKALSPFVWFGGKGRIADKIIPHLPDGHVYCEPYCGAASVFWHLDPPRNVEVLNDFNYEIITLWRTLQDKKQFEELAHRLTWTPYALDEFRRAIAEADSEDPVTRAWAFFVSQNMVIGGVAGKKTAGSWGRNFEEPGHLGRYVKRIAMLEHFHSRLSRVQLDNRDALEVIAYWDSPKSVFYIDPPYVMDTRKSGTYEHEADDEHHKKLVDLLLDIRGKALLSGYESALYKPLEEAGWKKIKIETSCSAAGRTRMSELQGTGQVTENAKRVEVLWIKA